MKNKMFEQLSSILLWPFVIIFIWTLASQFYFQTRDESTFYERAARDNRIFYDRMAEDIDRLEDDLEAAGLTPDQVRAITGGFVSVKHNVSGYVETQARHSKHYAWSQTHHVCGYITMMLIFLMLLPAIQKNRNEPTQSEETPADIA